MERKRGIRDAGFFGILLIVFCTGLLIAAGAGAADKVRFSMDWIIGGQHAIFFSGLDQGFYQRAGIEPTIHRGFGGTDTVKKVSVGAADFVFADIGAMVIARSRGAKVKALAAIDDKPQYVYFAFKGSGIKSPKDMEGRILADSAGSVTRQLFPALAAANGLDESKVKWLIVKPALIFQSVLAGKADMAAAFAVNKASLETQARKQGKEITGIYFGDWGVDIYTNGLQTSDEMIAKKPDVVRRFLRASLESMAWTAENRQTAISILLKHHPALGRKIARAHLEAIFDSALSPNILKEGLGHIRESKMRRTRDILTQYMKLPTKVPVKELYTLEFLPVIKVKAM
ncbi:MAG: ABC transporter substrate-binding protein [Nitrospinota bacterium]